MIVKAHHLLSSYHFPEFKQTSNVKLKLITHLLSHGFLNAFPKVTSLMHSCENEFEKEYAFSTNK